jgi:hypothetical protein
MGNGRDVRVEIEKLLEARQIERDRGNWERTGQTRKRRSSPPRLKPISWVDRTSKNLYARPKSWLLLRTRTASEVRFSRKWSLSLIGKGRKDELEVLLCGDDVCTIGSPSRDARHDGDDSMLLDVERSWIDEPVASRKDDAHESSEREGEELDDERSDGNRWVAVGEKLEGRVKGTGESAAITTGCVRGMACLIDASEHDCS